MTGRKSTLDTVYPSKLTEASSLMSLPSACHIANSVGQIKPEKPVSGNLALRLGQGSLPTVLSWAHSRSQALEWQSVFYANGPPMLFSR